MFWKNLTLRRIYAFPIRKALLFTKRKSTPEILQHRFLFSSLRLIMTHVISCISKFHQNIMDGKYKTSLPQNKTR